MNIIILILIDIIIDDNNSNIKLIIHINNNTYL
jgi:hypothetical protein